ncbi:TIGR03905 family TSCPD domain-containing protein [bacterium]|nr:TIGR03905 family TSCPD domain-containing protein [bacterium]
MKYQYATRGTCSELIFFDIDENTVVTNIKFIGGCNGNLKAVSKLVDGWTAAQIADKLLGNECGYKGTSCADQLAKAVLEAAEKVKKQTFLFQ